MDPSVYSSTVEQASSNADESSIYNNDPQPDVTESERNTSLYLFRLVRFAGQSFLHL